MTDNDPTLCKNLHLISIDSKGCTVFASNKTIALVGVEDLAVIVTDDTIFISKIPPKSGEKEESKCQNQT